MAEPRARYEKVSIQKFPVKLSNDRENCDISGCCMMDDGTIVLSDFKNYKIKLFDTNFSNVGQQSVMYSPWNLCRTERNTIAVTLNNKDPTVKSTIAGRREGTETEVHIFEVNGATLTATRRLCLSHPCCGIVYRNGELYVGTRVSIHKYSIQGKPLGLVYEDQSTNDSVWKFDVSTNGKRLYIPNFCRCCFVTSNADGRIEQVIQGKDRFDHPTASKVMPNGNVLFTTLVHMNKVLQVDPTGSSILSVLATKQDGLANVKSLYFHPTTNQLIIGQECNSVYMLQLREV